MKTKTLDLNELTVETFETANLVGALEGEKGTACWELCAADPTSDPDVDSCGPYKCV